MHNYNIKSLKGLKHYQPKWNNGETKTIRVPVKLADKILEIAHKIDNNEVSNDVNLLDNLLLIIEKIDNKEIGFKSNGAGKLIKELKSLIS